MPPFDSEWLDLPTEYLSLLQTLDKCNAGISAFWVWYAAQSVESEN